MVAAIRDERRVQHAYTQHELLQRREVPSDTGVGNLGLVQRREHSKHLDHYGRQGSPSVRTTRRLLTVYIL